ncbi:cytochrome P450 [Plesiomonas sp.]|uniref:cytochrome P450 n=1 Tax=Plesiomonas sp. TaxID=2486279 RepID=UPI003F2E05E3
MQATQFTIKDLEEGKAVFIGENFRVDHPFRITRQIFGPNVLDTEGQQHLTRKREWNASFGRRSILSDKYQSIIKMATAQGIEYARKKGNLFLVAEYTPNKVILDLLGCSHLDPIEHYKKVAPLVGYLETGSKPDHYAQARQYVREEQFYNNSDFFINMQEKERENDLSLLVGAGVETTVVAMKILLSAWAKNQQSFKHAIEKIGIDEFIVRLLDSDPPLGLATKYCSSDAKLGDKNVTKGDIVHVSIKDTNQSAKCPMHHHTDNSNSDAIHLTFGLGRHHCPGHLLAKAELSLLAEELLELDTNDFHITNIEPNYQRPINFRHPSPLVISPVAKSTVTN